MKKKYLAMSITLLLFVLVITRGYDLILEFGIPIDSYKGVTVYYNGDVAVNSHGAHFSDDGYYYGKKWQCVEFVKRFYYDAKQHAMPNVMGHAKEFFINGLGQGQLNKERGLIQYRNGSNVKPEVDDLLVYVTGKYGHVAIISSVENGWLEIIQQNVSGKSRQKVPLTYYNGKYYVGFDKSPAGWLRKP